jgi:twinkle protein
MTFIVDRDIDFARYMAATDHDHRVVSAEAFAEEVRAFFHDPHIPRGALTPWAKVGNNLRFRPSEVTIWGGVNGHGKSLLLGMVATSIAAQGEPVCIASMEMLPRSTLSRMCRQASQVAKPSPEFIKHFHETLAGNLFVYDHVGATRPDKLLAVIRFAATERGIKHFVVDSLMKCGLDDEDYRAEKRFIGDLCTVARDHGIHIHLVCHSRKGRDEDTAPNKMDIKGSGAIVDQVDNLVIVWRNKRKEFAQQQGDHARRDEPDVLMIVEKQRHHEWEGRISLWFDPASLQYLGHASASPIPLLTPPRQQGNSNAL